jgi:signal transduction histidine kinase
LTAAHAALRESELALRRAQADLGAHAGQLERLVSERTAELRASNEHLEAFVFSIAHDLRAPLRSMEGFSALLLEEAASELSQASQDYARRINRSAQAMDALLRDLLDFSRLSQQQIRLVPVNLGNVLQDVVSRLETQIQESQAELELPRPLPFVLGHEATLSQVLFNLLTNALKFRKPGERAVVRVWAEDYSDDASAPPSPREAHGGWVRVWVEDRGIGIAPEHQRQIFKLFTRLNGEKYPGTGVGLAIVHKGLQRMGGTVGINSTAGEGVRIWFALRKAAGAPPLP